MNLLCMNGQFFELFQIILYKNEIKFDYTNSINSDNSSVGKVR